MFGFIDSGAPWALGGEVSGRLAGGGGMGEGVAQGAGGAELGVIRAFV